MFTFALKQLIWEFIAFQDVYEFLEAVIMRQTAPEEAYRKLDEMAAKLTESLRKSTKEVSFQLTVSGLLGIPYHIVTTRVNNLFFNVEAYVRKASA